MIIEDLKKGKLIGLVSDAGTPGICDPGERLVQKCVEENLSFSSLPGACAALQGLISSGLPTNRFQFCGILARQSTQLKEEIQTILQYTATTVCYESPHRLLTTLKVILELAPNRLLVVARELTKKFEEIKRGTAQQLMNNWQQTPLKGEIVLLFSPASETALDWSYLSIEEHVAHLQESYQLSLKEAIKIVAQLRQVPKREIYTTVHQLD